MIEFNVPRMSCGSCVRTITEAVKRVDPAAEVEIDLGAKRAAIASETDSARIAAAIEAAGYPVQRAA
jgi:copper chaperone CopZ